MIPRILHQAWVGPKQIPEREKQWCAQMKQINPTWDVRFYGNEILQTYFDDPYVKALQHLEKPWAFVTDRLRMLLLRDYGGVWLDPDCQPIRPLDTIKHVWDSSFTFAYGTRSPDRPQVALHRNVSLIDNTFLASAPNSRMCQRILDLWRPQSVVIDGHAVGIQILRHQNLGVIDTLPLPHHYFYSMQNLPSPTHQIPGHCPHSSFSIDSWVGRSRPLRSQYAHTRERNALNGCVALRNSSV